MIDAIKWFKSHGFTFNDKITIADVLELQSDAKCEGIEAGEDLYQAARMVMLYKKDKTCWHNLENAVNRFDAARQAAHNDAIKAGTKPTFEQWVADTIGTNDMACVLGLIRQSQKAFHLMWTRGDTEMRQAALEFKESILPFSKAKITTLK